MQNEYMVLLMALGWILLMLGVVGGVLWIATSIRNRHLRRKEMLGLRSEEEGASQI